MFTEEQKIRAIELYFKYGKKLAPVVRELGYPSKRNLRRWIRSWQAGGGAKESIRHKHRYSDEQKQVAVEHYLNHGCCLAFTSRMLTDIFNSNCQCYGYRRLHAMFRHEGRAAIRKNSFENDLRGSEDNIFCSITGVH